MSGIRLVLSLTTYWATAVGRMGASSGSQRPGPRRRADVVTERHRLHHRQRVLQGMHDDTLRHQPIALRAMWKTCPTHDADEAFQNACTDCGRCGCQEHWGICTACEARPRTAHTWTTQAGQKTGCVRAPEPSCNDGGPLCSDNLALPLPLKSKRRSPRSATLCRWRYVDCVT
jgi:hypothetical protein